MAKKSVKKPFPMLESEEDADQWLQQADLTKYFTGDEFYKVRFGHLEKKLIDESYENSLKSQPVTLRLSLDLIQTLKLAAMKQGIAYQTLAKLLLQKNVKRLLKNS